MSATLW